MDDIYWALLAYAILWYRITDTRYNKVMKMQEENLKISNLILDECWRSKRSDPPLEVALEQIQEDIKSRGTR